MAKIKLLILNDNDFNSGFGGQASFIKNLHPYLENEYDLKYLILPAFWFKQHIIPIRLLYLIRVFLYLLVKGRRYRFILSHTPEASFVCTFFRIPFIHIFHGNTNALEKSVFWYGKYLKWVFRLFEKRIIKNAAILYTVGESRPDAKKFYNPIEISEKVVEQSYSPKKGFVFAGRLEELKQVDRIISIYLLLSEDIRNAHPLHIIGSGTQETKLKKQVATLGLDEHVKFYGLVKNTQSIEIISGCSVLFMASLHEGFPMVIAESLTVGTPVISTDVGDIKSIVKNGYNGHLLPLDFSNQQYIDGIELIMKNFELYSKNARNSSGIFNAKDIAGCFINDCKSILN